MSVTIALRTLHVDFFAEIPLPFRAGVHAPLIDVTDHTAAVARLALLLNALWTLNPCSHNYILRNRRRYALSASATVNHDAPHSSNHAHTAGMSRRRLTHDAGAVLRQSPTTPPATPVAFLGLTADAKRIAE